VGRIAVVGVLSAIAVWLAIDALITTDAERVEMEIERLLGLARMGGEDAAAQILDAIAEDYRGAYSRDAIGRYLRQFLVEDRPEEITLGTPMPVPKGGEILVPLLRVDVRTRHAAVSTVLRVTFARRGDRFRIVSVENWGGGR
jgi:hypothetical protein